MRLLHSLRAEWSVGSSCSAGWEGEEEGRGRRRPGLEEGPRRAGLGRAGGDGLEGSPGGRNAPHLTSLLRHRSLLLDHYGHLPAPCPGVLEPSRPGFSPCCPFPKPQTQERIAPGVLAPFFPSQSHSQAFV